MELKLASAWIYNKGESLANLSDVGACIQPNQYCDLFKINPQLTWQSFMRSKTIGSIKSNANVVLISGPPPAVNHSEDSTFPDSKPAPIASRSKTCIIAGESEDDYMAVIESEFPPGSQQLGQTELWNSERNKFLKNIEKSELGIDGEVFSDNLFEEEYLSEST